MQPNTLKQTKKQTNTSIYQKENTVICEGCSNLAGAGLDQSALWCLIYNDEADKVE